MMATLAPSRATAASMELRNLSSLSTASHKAAEQLTSILNTAEVSFEEDIPSLDYEPRLEDILNDDEGERLLTVAELGLEEVLQETEEDSLLPSSFRDRPPHKQQQQSVNRSTTEGAILRQEILSGIANQLSQATLHNQAGLPTVMAVRGCFAIGTSHGLVLMFDWKQQLKSVLNPYQKGGPGVNVGFYGAVSAVDISSDGTRLICGYAKGLITHWDLTSHKCLRFITDAHPPGFGVLRVRFLDDPTLALFINTGGNLFTLKFRRTIVGRNWTSDCIFSGCHGEALTFEPLLMGAESPLSGFSVLAIASVTQAIFITLTPKIEPITSLSLKGSAKYLPQLAWNLVVIEHRTAGKVYTTTDAVLAAVRERTINYVQCSLDNKGQPVLKMLRKIEVPFEIMAFQWVDAYTVAALDPKEKVHLLSVKDDSEVEVFDLGHLELVYNSSFFKSIETGGNVSKALIVGSEHACYNSIASYDSKLFVLGLKAVHAVSIKTWKERLRILVRENRMDEAIQLGLDLYENKARAVVGLSGPPKKRRGQVAEELVDILKGYVDMGVMMQKPSAGGERELRRHYKVLVTWAFDVCLRIKKHELLFTSVYDTFRSEDDLSRSVFLEHLCSFIIDGKIRHIRTLIVKDLISHYSQKGDYQLLEKCFLQILPQCLDIHQVVEICMQQQLYDGLIHVHNRSLHDYGTPLLELLLYLRAHLIAKTTKTLPSDAQKLGYKLLVYVRCCASGMGYPSGKVPPDEAQLARTSVYEVLLAPTNTHNHNDKERYPHIHTLLHFDTREFLNVLAMAFEEPDFDAAMSDTPPPGVPTRQQVVSVLLEVMVGDRADQTFSPSQVGSLFTFLARQGAKHRTSIHVEEGIYDQVLNYITHTDVDIVNEERQQALLELWHVGVLKKFDEEKLLVRAEAARFYRLCEQVYEKRRQFGKVLSCYLRDPNRRHQAFAYVHSVMTEDQYTEPDREEVSRAMLDKFQVLVEADVAGAARLVLMDFPLELSEITHRLQSTQETQFAFLQGIFDPKQANRQEVGAPSHVVERYIDLLCRYQPQDVYGFLHSNDNYRVEEALDVCSKAKLMDATAYLLERSGDILGAFKLIRETLGKELQVLSERYYRQEADLSDKDLGSWVERVEGVLTALLTFCQRNSGKLASKDKARQALWFPTFDRVHELQRKYKDSRNKRLVELYNAMIADILNAMLGYVSLQDILQKIIEDPSYQFKDIKQLMMGMLETYNYEETLLKKTNHILIHDVRQSLDNLCALVQRGVSPHSRLCVICSRPSDCLADGSRDDVLVFSCGHLYHASCLGVDTVDPGHMSHSCIVCHKTSAPLPGRGRTHTTSGPHRGRSFTTQRSVRDQVGLDPVQRENLRKLTMSYKSNPNAQPSVKLQLAPPKL